jgi:sugar/nucleoside kinase (ribokinase family)
VGASLHFDYTTVGHVTIDEIGDGSHRPGGSAFYSALQAARLGARTLIITRGVASEIEELLAPYAGELEVQVLNAQETTVLRTSGSGQARCQRVLAWAGPIPDGVEVQSTVLHLAPVARESPSRWSGRADFVGLTPQGLARKWAGIGEEVVLAAPDLPAIAVADSCDALVLSAVESYRCAALLDRASAAGALVVVTSEGGPNALRLPDGSTLEVPVPTLTGSREDLGAGDVYAAALFLSLAEGHTPPQAARFANAAAAVRMLGHGAQAIGDRGAIEARLRESAPAA